MNNQKHAESTVGCTAVVRTARSRPHDIQSKVQNGERSRGFLFVPNSGEKVRIQDRQQLKMMRAHVQHNYVERHKAEEMGYKPQRVNHDRLRPNQRRQSQSEPPVFHKLQMRFRLRPNGLERRHPYRYAKNNAKAKPEHNSNKTPTQVLRTSESCAIENGTWSPPVVMLGTTRMDPFGTMAVRVDPKDEDLLYKFHKLNRYPWCPINGHSSWSGFAMSDQLVLHVTLYSSGSHFNRQMRQSSDHVRVMQHKLAAISLINERLSDQEQATSDATIAAVAALTNIALAEEAFSEARKHMHGLETMVRMRGGLSALSSGVEHHLQRLISWNDLIYSEVYDAPLMFPPIDVWDESWGTLHDSKTFDLLPGLSQEELRAAGFVRNEVVDLIENIRTLCYAEMTNPLVQTEETCRMKRADMFHRIERRLRLSIECSKTPNESQSKSRIWRAASLAALLYTHHYLRGNPLTYRHFATLSMLLYDSLVDMSEELKEFDFAPAMLIWILSTGSVVSVSTPVNDFFLSLLAKTCARYGLGSEHQYLWALSGFLWTGEADERRYSALWRAIHPLRTSGG
ncbi:hypothetical protein RBB50_000352 [Rhinocladiella similis]